MQQKIRENARNKLLDFYKGLEAYTAESLDVWQPDAKVIWQEGSTRILDYGANKNSGGKKILFISPLINRANILDLSGDKSLMKFLQQEGYNPLLVDWQNPENDEKDFDSDAYVQRLIKFASTQKDLIIGGYCMGGMLALKLAKLLKPKALILLATPWNFHAPDVKRVQVKERTMDKFLSQMEYVPPEVLQTMFLTADHWRVYNKYSSIGAGHGRLKNMVEIENWVNNGVAMSVPMAKESIIGWAINNKPGKGEWLDVGEIDMPVFLGCTMKDKIVPIGCSIPLAGLLPRSELFKFDCGHIGMMTRKLCFKPMAEWLKKTV